MVDLFKYLMSKPLEAIVATLCIVIVTMQSGLFEVREAQAVLISQQTYNDVVNNKVFAMNETLIRIDTNVLNMKEQQENWDRVIHKRSVELQTEMAYEPREK